jgi:hypothetical protein
MNQITIENVRSAMGNYYVVKKDNTCVETFPYKDEADEKSTFNRESMLFQAKELGTKLRNGWTETRTLIEF